jgi:hypothetical protein
MTKDNIIPFKKKKRMLDASTPYFIDKAKEVEDVSLKLLDFLKPYDPEISFVSTLIASICLIKQNPDANFDKSSAISLIEYMVIDD